MLKKILFQCNFEDKKNIKLYRIHLFLIKDQSLHEREGSLYFVASILLFFPARSDGLHLGVEFHTCLAVEVQIASKWSLCNLKGNRRKKVKRWVKSLGKGKSYLVSGEGEHWERYWDRKINTNLTAFDIMLEISSSISWSSEDSCSISPRIAFWKKNQRNVWNYVFSCAELFLNLPVNELDGFF